MSSFQAVEILFNLSQLLQDFEMYDMLEEQIMSYTEKFLLLFFFNLFSAKQFVQKILSEGYLIILCRLDTKS